MFTFNFIREIPVKVKNEIALKMNRTKKKRFAKKLKSPSIYKKNPYQKFSPSILYEKSP